MTDSSKILIAYFSKTGNTEEVAKQIQTKVGGELFHIKTVTPYPEDYRKTTDIAKDEQRENARPEIINKPKDIAKYDVIFLGYPNWWHTMPMAVFTFLESYDLRGKTIIPFCTHEGSGLGGSVSDIRSEAPNAKVEHGLAIRGSSVTSDAAHKSIDKWLTDLGLTTNE